MVLNKKVSDRKNNGKIVGGNIGIGIEEVRLFEDKVAMIYTSEEHKNITSRIDSLKEETASLKQQLEEANQRIKELETNKRQDVEDATSGIQQDFETRLNEINAKNESIVNEYEGRLNAKDNTINKQQDTIQNKDTTIATLQQQVKEYEDKAIEVADVVAKYNEANIERSKQHNKEVASLTEANIFITNKYNALRLAVSNASTIDLIFRSRKKDILIEYQEIKPSDAEAIETQTSDTTDT